MSNWLRCSYGHVFHLKSAHAFEIHAGPDSLMSGVSVACQCGDRELVTVPDAVVKAMTRKFEESRLFEEMMASLKYDSLMGCYHFTYAGMYHGVENDGYLHT